MLSEEVKIKYIGGPTALLEIGGLNFLTDPTFDKKNTKYKTNFYELHKISDPKISANEVGKIDYVLLSHDHHFDNLDNIGRQLLPSANRVYTTIEGSERLGGNSEGLNVWETIEVPLNDDRVITITATPCRHGPVDGDRGPVIGFVINFKGETDGAVYISGDTVLYEGVEEVAKKFTIRLILLFMGKAIVKEVGSAHLTMTSKEAVDVAKIFPNAKIIPLHFEGWKHYNESKEYIYETFKKSHLLHRLIWINKF